ncbi:MAG: hypothetical protein ACNYPH_03915 [Gammaproteobacteria bacterium WSBS_2016_MAG_OTU1]
MEQFAFVPPHDANIDEDVIDKSTKAWVDKIVVLKTSLVFAILATIIYWN